MQALTLINLCAREYQDVGFARIAKAHWLDWLNDAQRNIVLVRPDANVVTAAVPLVAGTRQDLLTAAPTAIRLHGVMRNMGGDGLTPGKIIRLVDREVQDAVSEDWHTASNASPVRELIYDDKKSPTVFWVRPGAVDGWHIEISYSAEPAPLTDPDAGATVLPDIYAGPMQAWMLYRAYALATQALNQFQRAQFYFSTFFNLLGVKLRGEMFHAAATPGALPGQVPGG